MNRKDSPQSVIDSYRRRQQMAPYFMAGLAVLLVVVGIIILVVWFTGSGKTQVGAISLFSSPTPTVTSSATPTPVTPTATFTSTATVTETATVTITPTPSGPFEYTVQEGDICWDIAAKYKVDVEVLLTLNNFTPGTCPIKPKDKILIPQPGAELPTETSIPAEMTGKFEYYVKSGESLGTIAEKFNTTVDEIKKENKIDDANNIKAGDKLIIPVNTYKSPTPTKTKVPPTATKTPKP